jgi:L-fucose isomerase-like protein
LKEEMAMKRNRYLLVTGTVVLVCLIAAAVSTAIPDNGKKYEIDTVVDVPEYKTDAARAIDAYERLMDKYMDLSEKIVLKIGGDSQAVSTKLDSLDSRLADISTRLARIEKALGVDPNSEVITKQK